MNSPFRLLCVVLLVLTAPLGFSAAERPRVIVTTDIGGTDPDDYQSMAHVLLYADTLEIEGLISSPFERPGKDKILEVIGAYAQDHPNLRTWSSHYPGPDALRAMTKQGGIHPAPYSGLRGTTEGSDWIGRCARRDDPRPFARFDRFTTAADRIEIFGIVEFVLPLGPGAPAKPEGHMVVTNQSLRGHPDGEGNLRFRFCPRDPNVFSYVIRSNAPALDGRKGEIAAHLPDPTTALRPSSRFPNWWVDDPAPAMAEGIHHGARSVSQWREDYLRDFASRMERCVRPAPTTSTRAQPP